ncbi:TerD family protein [Nocardia mangyaensis]|uniref:TerD family protein n=1 Tax=Nocardia mangyaensis TaxID=2213200 RepID=UPI0026748719|nr:TerD family protein [Nocardia mangyaensis]MDO3646485.1 TerD family protein [Nocardia mangyaensis]
MSQTAATVGEVAKGSKTDLVDGRYTVRLDLTAPAGAVDVSAVLVTADGKVRSDADFVFFNNPSAPGVQMESDAVVSVDLSALPADIHRVVIAGSTEAQGIRFGEVTGLRIAIAGASQSLTFVPSGLATETVLQAVALYRRGNGWRLDAVGQGYSAGLAAFATEHGISVEEEPAAPSPQPVAPQHPVPPQPVGAPQYPGQPPQYGAQQQPHAAAPHQVRPAPASAIDLRKVDVVLTKDSPSRRASIDLRKGDPGYVLTVGLEWDGRGAKYDQHGRVTQFGTGDLDVYFFCRNEITGDYVVISGEKGHQGDLNTWPFMHHQGDSLGPGANNLPATEQVIVRPNENGDLLLNVYQSVDNGAGAIDKFGNPRVRVRYGRPGPDGLPGPDADQITVVIGNGKNSFWATVAHIDVREGILTVDGTVQYSRAFSERMPVLDTAGNWVRSAKNGPVGRSKKSNGLGLSSYSGRCPDPR